MCANWKTLAHCGAIQMNSFLSFQDTHSIISLAEKSTFCFSAIVQYNAERQLESHDSSLLTFKHVWRWEQKKRRVCIHWASSCKGRAIIYLAFATWNSPCFIQVSCCKSQLWGAAFFDRGCCIKWEGQKKDPFCMQSCLQLFWSYVIRLNFQKALCT